MELDAEILELIITTIIAWLPAVGSIIGSIITILKLFGKFKELKEEVQKNTEVQTELDETKAMLKASMQQTVALQQQVIKLVTTVTKINQKVEEIQNDGEI